MAVIAACRVASLAESLAKSAISESFGSERAGDRCSNARADTRDDDDRLHGIRLCAGDMVIGEV